MHHLPETDSVEAMERMAVIAGLLIDACLNNQCVQEYLADAELPHFNSDALRNSPIVRVQYEEATAIGCIGAALRATRSKSWGDGPAILPLRPDDWFYPRHITYQYHENSRHRRRFEQRRRMKELLGRRHRRLVKMAMSHTRSAFLDRITNDERRAIQRIFTVNPGVFWRAAKGNQFLELPARAVQLELAFPEPVHDSIGEDS